MSEIIKPPAQAVYPGPANPTRLRITRWLLRRLGEFLFTKTWVKVTLSGAEYVPATEPTIVVFNHANSWDPILTGLMIPQRDLVPITKIELSESLLTGWITWSWQTIPIKRGEVDRQALKRALEVLRTPDMLLVSPEGHRNRDGMRNPKEGIALMANQSGAIILPVGVSGAENYLRNLRRLRRTAVTVNIGRPFKLKSGIHRKAYTQATQEIMYQIAPLVAPNLRGDYGDLSKASMETLEYV